MDTFNKPTDSELEILQILWEEGPSTVRKVNELLNQRRETGYTTTLKFMQIMYEKGVLSRQKQGKTHLYTATISQGQTQGQLLDRFIDKVFNGSATKLMMQALGRRQASAEEVAALKKILEDLETNPKEDENGTI